MLTENDENAERIRIQKVYEERERLIPADTYSLANAGNLSIKQEKNRHLFSWLLRSGYIPLNNKKILDVGCGRGYSLRNLLSWGAKPENLFGIDVIPADIEQARRSVPKANLEVGNATRLKYADETFDFVQQVTVFSSIIREDIRRRIAAEMLRVLKTGGHIIWYDALVDNPWNPNVRGAGKRQIQRLFPHCHYEFERITLAPPIARMMGRVIPKAYDRLAGLRVFCTHYLAFLNKLTDRVPDRNAA